MKKIPSIASLPFLLTLIISACSPASQVPPTPSAAAAATQAANTEAPASATAAPAATETIAPASLVIAPDTLGQLRFFWNAEFPGDLDAELGCGLQREACTLRSSITDYVFSADGNTLAVGVCLGIRTTDWFKTDGDIWGCTADSAIILYDSATGEELGRLTPAALPLSLAFHPDGAILAAGLANSDTEVWDLGSGDLISALPGPIQFTGAYPVAFALDGERLLTGSGPGQVIDNAVTGRRVVGAEINVWDWSAAELVTTIERVVGIGINPDGTKLATNTVGNSGGPLSDTVRIYDLAQPDQFAEFIPEGQFRPEHIYFNPVNGWIATVEEAMDAVVANFWDPQSYELVDSFGFDEDFDDRGFLYDLNSGGFTADGYFLLTENGPVAEAPDGELQECGFALADVEANQIYFVSNPMPWEECDALYVIYGTKALILSPDGRFIAGEGGNGSLRLWGIDASLPAVPPDCSGEC